jgi:hypothetical protein
MRGTETPRGGGGVGYLEPPCSRLGIDTEEPLWGRARSALGLGAIRDGKGKSAAGGNRARIPFQFGRAGGGGDQRMRQRI